MNFTYNGEEQHIINHINQVKQLQIGVIMNRMFE